jgi:hypothetical protein
MPLIVNGSERGDSELAGLAELAKLESERVSEATRQVCFGNGFPVEEVGGLKVHENATNMSGKHSNFHTYPP